MLKENGNLNLYTNLLRDFGDVGSLPPERIGIKKNRSTFVLLFAMKLLLKFDVAMHPGI